MQFLKLFRIFSKIIGIEVKVKFVAICEKKNYLKVGNTFEYKNRSIFYCTLL